MDKWRAETPTPWYMQPLYEAGVAESGLELSGIVIHQKEEVDWLRNRFWVFMMGVHQSVRVLKDLLKGSCFGY